MHTVKWHITFVMCETVYSGRNETGVGSATGADDDDKTRFIAQHKNTAFFFFFMSIGQWYRGDEHSRVMHNINASACSLQNNSDLISLLSHKYFYSIINLYAYARTTYTESMRIHCLTLLVRYVGRHRFDCTLVFNNVQLISLVCSLHLLQNVSGEVDAEWKRDRPRCPWTDAITINTQLRIRRNSFSLTLFYCYIQK